MDALKDGEAVSDEDMLGLLNATFAQPDTKLKGFILDLPFETGSFWLDALTKNQLTIPKYLHRPFTHIIELKNNDFSVLNHQNQIYESPENFKLFSEYDREMLRRPKPKVEGQEEEEEDEENVQKPVAVEDLVKRPSESHQINEENFKKISDYISFQLPNLQE